MMILLAIALGTFCATTAGGAIAFRLHDKLHLILGFSAGAVIGVAMFDLMPEAVELASRYNSAQTLPVWLALAFAAYMGLDRLAPVHHLGPGHNGNDRLRAALGAGSLSLHSFLDGFGIGLAFHVSSSVGAVVAIAVLAHDFSDGINTMNMVLKNGGNRRLAIRWLLADALAPAVGIGASYLVALPDRLLGSLLAVFAGFFLYIGASELVPESYHAHPKALTTATTALGMAVIYFAIRFAG